MSLKFKVETLEGVDEQSQGLYEQVDDGYQLKIEGLPEQEDVGGLKSALQKERDAAKEAQRRLKDLEAQQEAERQKNLEENEQYKELWQTAKEEKENLIKNLESTEKNHRADLFVSKMTQDDSKSKLLKDIFLKSTELKDGSIVPTGIAGIETLEEFKAHIEERYPFLLDGNKASGGGAVGSGDGGTSQKMITKEAFDAMSPGEQMQFQLQGGKFKTE